MTASEVLAGQRRWSVERADCLQWAATLPDDSIDLLVTSPPYERARTYGISKDLPAGQEWVNWMAAVVRAFAPKVKGLIAINCEGQTRDYRYSATPLLLAADLHRAGFNLRKPMAFHRVGIPGSGGPDWVRNDWEPIICVTRPGKLPWSDATACGHPPKWAPGGEMAHRLSDGTRVNQWGPVGSHKGTTATGNKEKQTEGKPRPPHKFLSMSSRGPDGKRKIAGGRKLGTATRGGPNGDTQTVDGVYDPPTLANPGNVIRETYTADEVAAMLAEANDLFHASVGGGVMGSKKAHKNEAPFPLTLPTFFIRSFCPPDGIVCDPFSGSGTTCHAAIPWGRRFVGCDVRQSEIDNTIARMNEEGTGLFDFTETS